MRSRSRRHEGFTLVELMIVVAVIAVVLAMAIPSLAAARVAANESSAVSTARTLATVMEQYHTRFGNYPMLWADIESAGYLSGFSSGEVHPGYAGAPNAGGKSGYTFAISAFPGIPWRVMIVPNDPGTSGDRYFYVDSSGVIRQNTGALAGPSSLPVS